MSGKDGYTKLSVEIPDDLLERFDIASLEDGKNRDEAIEKCMKDYVVAYGISNSLDDDPKGWALQRRVAEFEELFDEMMFDFDSITEEFLKGGHEGRSVGIPDILKVFDYSGYAFVVEDPESVKKGLAWYDSYEHTLHVREDVFHEDYIILHEMIHLYEHRFKRTRQYFRDVVMLSLYRDLKPKLLAMDEDLDALLLKMVNAVDVSTIANTYGEHGIFFCLKSLDLDIKKGYPLGTVFSYQSVFQ